MITADQETITKTRPLLAIFLLFSLPILIGATLSPYVFNFLREVGETTDNFQKLTGASFERITSRCVMIVAALILFPVIRMTGLWSQVRKGLCGGRERYRDLYTSILIGGVSMALVFLVGWHLDAFVINPKLPDASRIAMKIGGFIVGATFIGVFEEIFFRGFVYGALRTRLAFPAAMVVSSLIFSGIHFFRPLAPEVVVHATWTSGLALIPHMFDRFVWEHDVLFALTLFVMGLTLSTYYEKRGNLYFIIGLHGGWVLAMQTGSFLFDRDRDVLPVLYGPSDFASKGALALAIVSLFYVSSLLAKPGSAVKEHPHP